jgi:hypothetical protein
VPSPVTEPADHYLILNAFVSWFIALCLFYNLLGCKPGLSAASNNHSNRWLFVALSVLECLLSNFCFLD